MKNSASVVTNDFTVGKPRVYTTDYVRVGLIGGQIGFSEVELSGFCATPMTPERFDGVIVT